MGLIIVNMFSMAQKRRISMLLAAALFIGLFVALGAFTSAPAQASAPPATMVASSSLGVKPNCKGIGGKRVADYWLDLNVHAKVFVNKKTGRTCTSAQDFGDSGNQVITYRHVTYDGLCNLTNHVKSVSRQLANGAMVALWSRLGYAGRSTVSSAGHSRTVTAKKDSYMCAT